jgi:LysM repeat protein
MKILKFSGIVVGIHLLGLILILVNPGCSSSTKSAPSTGDTVAKADPTITVPSSSGSGAATDAPPAISFNPDTSVRYSPTRPNTPAASTLQTEPVTNVTPASTYTVVGGDSLWSIANKNHITINELAAANNLNAKSNPKLRPGQKLIIPSKVAAPAKTPDHALSAASVAQPGTTTTPTANADTSAMAKAGGASGDVVKHTVKSGETLSTIARKYGVKQGDIAVANNISDPQKIRAGMELTIPGWQSPATKTSHAKSTPSEPAPKPATMTMPEIPVDSTPRPPASDVPVIQVDEVPPAAK